MTSSARVVRVFGVALLATALASACAAPEPTEKARFAEWPATAESAEATGVQTWRIETLGDGAIELLGLRRVPEGSEVRFRARLRAVAGVKNGLRLEAVTPTAWFIETAPNRLLGARGALPANVKLALAASGRDARVASGVGLGRARAALSIRGGTLLEEDKDNGVCLILEQVKLLEEPTAADWASAAARAIELSKYYPECGAEPERCPTMVACASELGVLDSAFAEGRSGGGQGLVNGGQPLIDDRRDVMGTCTYHRELYSGGVLSVCSTTSCTTLGDCNESFVRYGGRSEFASGACSGSSTTTCVPLR
ncbi:MAG: hypothetical protein JST00_36490 [Deltaproteobacteria bacterium]|nr:hypothetical protein [Deltaproteobacteria bacterium]